MTIGGLREHHHDVPIVLQAPGIEPSWIHTTGPLAITPLVGAPNGDRLAAAIEEAIGMAAEAKAAAFFG